MNEIYDVIGPWSEIKLEIIKRYASEYTKILSKQKSPSFHYIYIDAFAGTGIHKSRKTGDYIPGSPLNALEINPPFKEYHFIDIEKIKVESLEKISRDRENVNIYHGDCNKILLEEIFPKAKYEDYCRALCILDPYGLHLDWQVIKKAGEMKTIEIFLNFPIYDMNLNVLLRNPDKINQQQENRMNSFWGDESWKDIVYEPIPTLFGNSIEKLLDYDIKITDAFKDRLIRISGFKYVPNPIRMVNNNNGTLYYLFFASHKPVSSSIVKYIFDKYSKGLIR